jgi:methylphosphotriester-DNA--protein-cysteine methyltransferase
MSWVGWLLALFIAYWFLSDLFRSKRCYPHGVFGPCRRCEEEAAARVKAEAEARVEAARQRMEIEETYENLDEAKKDELTTLVKERAKREDLIIGPGDLEAAIVRMHKRAQIKETKRGAGPA